VGVYGVVSSLAALSFFSLGIINEKIKNGLIKMQNKKLLIRWLRVLLIPLLRNCTCTMRGGLAKNVTRIAENVLVNNISNVRIIPIGLGRQKDTLEMAISPLSTATASFQEDIKLEILKEGHIFCTI